MDWIFFSPNYDKGDNLFDSKETMNQMNLYEDPSQVLRAGERYDIFGNAAKNCFTTGESIIVNRPTPSDGTLENISVGLYNGEYVPPHFACVKFAEPPKEIKAESSLVANLYTPYSPDSVQSEVPSWMSDKDYRNEGRFWIAGQGSDKDGPTGFHDDLFGTVRNQTQEAVVTGGPSAALPPVTQSGLPYKDSFSQPGFTQVGQGPVKKTVSVIDSLKIV